MSEATASAEIARFRAGAQFAARPGEFVIDGVPDEAALVVLHRALLDEPDPVGEAVARLVASTGVEADPAGWAGSSTIRDRRVLAILVAGLGRGRGLTRDACLGALEAHAPPPALAEFEAALVDDLTRRPDRAAFLVVAKGKLASAASHVRVLAATPPWADDEAAMIALAAFGDPVQEGRFTRAFTAANDAREKIRLARVLARIGSKASLTALAGALRTPLVFTITSAFDRSVRVDVIEALAHVLVDEPILRPAALVDDEGYAAIERWAEARFGVTWASPRPPFLTVRGRPRRA